MTSADARALKIDELGLSTRATNCLGLAGCHRSADSKYCNTIGDVIDWCESKGKHLLHVRNLGRSTRVEILNALRAKDVPQKLIRVLAGSIGTPGFAYSYSERELEAAGIDVDKLRALNGRPPRKGTR